MVRACTVLRFIASFSEGNSTTTTGFRISNFINFHVPTTYHSITGIRLPVSHANANDHGVSVVSDLHRGLAR